METPLEPNTSAVLASTEDCRSLPFPGERQRATPASDAVGVVDKALLAPGRRACVFREEAALVFVGSVGGDPVQKLLREQCPDHPATGGACLGRGAAEVALAVVTQDGPAPSSTSGAFGCAAASASDRASAEKPLALTGLRLRSRKAEGRRNGG